MDRDSFIEQLIERAHPIDRPFPEMWIPYYRSLFEVSKRLSSRRICEIGVRAGYSAFAMLSANPRATMLGIEADLDETKEDTHGGRKGLWRHAVKLLEPFDYDLLLVDSHAIKCLPQLDLFYVDGDPRGTRVPDCPPRRTNLDL